ncbi:MAG: hypothetical protein FJ091_14935 [Deltaproteobacteria bacterium]|nr:hypothetical protein [Deltaproteobacteria bacterium]
MRRVGFAAGAVCVGWWLAVAALAQESGAPPAEPVAAEPAVALDQLLTLPEDRTYAVDKKGGLTRGEWRRRFHEVRADLVKEREALEATEVKLEDAAGAAWSVNPIPGSETDTSRSPVDFQLRTELRRHREEIERLERKLRQLGIEANLAGVPEEWRS